MVQLGQHSAKQLLTLALQSGVRYFTRSILSSSLGRQSTRCYPPVQGGSPSTVKPENGSHRSTQTHGSPVIPNPINVTIKMNHYTEPSRGATRKQNDVEVLFAPLYCVACHTRDVKVVVDETRASSTGTSSHRLYRGRCDFHCSAFHLHSKQKPVPQTGNQCVKRFLYCHVHKHHVSKTT